MFQFHKKIFTIGSTINSSCWPLQLIHLSKHRQLIKLYANTFFHIALFKICPWKMHSLIGASRVASSGYQISAAETAFVHSLTMPFRCYNETYLSGGLCRRKFVDNAKDFSSLYRDDCFCSRSMCLLAPSSSMFRSR